jgi:hypothetical protein
MRPGGSPRCGHNPLDGHSEVANGFVSVPRYERIPDAFCGVGGFSSSETSSAGRAAARWSWCAALSEMAITSKARVLEGVLGRGLAAGQLLDPLLGCRDDGMVGVVVLLQTKRLPVERSPDVLLLASR